MRTVNWLMIVLCAGALALAGCGKKEPPPPAAGTLAADMPKLREAFANASPDLQAAVSEVHMGVRYGDYSRAFAGLTKLGSAPNLTDDQKKIVGVVTDEVKQMASKAPGAPPQ
jgi:predicted small lipoprotein YifL